MVPVATLDDKKLDILVRLVLQSRKFHTLDAGVVKKQLLKELRKDRSLQRVIERGDERSLMRNKSVKNIIRRVRASLFILHSAYYGKRSDVRWKLLEKLGKNVNESDDKVLELHKKILHCHTSTRERMSFYEELYRDIFAITGKPQSILDLGCGLNPVSLPFMHLDQIKYVASDFTTTDCDFATQYFSIIGKRYGVDGKALCINLLEEDGLKQLASLGPVDVCFLFKVSDLIDRKGHKPTEKILRIVNSNYVIVSFSTKTLSGVHMDKQRRVWFELMVERLGYSYRIIEKKNELFYVVNKH